MKQLQSSQQNSENNEWHKPQYLQHIALQQECTDSPQSQFKRSPKKNSLAEGISNKRRFSLGPFPSVLVLAWVGSLASSNRVGLLSLNPANLSTVRCNVEGFTEGSRVPIKLIETSYSTYSHEILDPMDHSNQVAIRRGGHQIQSGHRPLSCVRRTPRGCVCPALSWTEVPKRIETFNAKALTSCFAINADPLPCQIHEDNNSVFNSLTGPRPEVATGGTSMLVNA